MQNNKISSESLLPNSNVSSIQEEEMACCSPEFYRERLFPKQFFDNTSVIFTRCCTFPENFKLTDKIAAHVARLFLISSITAIIGIILEFNNVDEDPGKNFDDFTFIQWMVTLSIMLICGICMLGAIFFMWLPILCCGSQHSDMNIPPLPQ